MRWQLPELQMQISSLQAQANLQPAALVGIFEAYEAMTGEAVQDNVVDAALNELVVTGELESFHSGVWPIRKWEEFIAYIKSLIAEKGLTDEKSINEAIDEACDKYGVTLSDDERQKIVGSSFENYFSWNWFKWTGGLRPLSTIPLKMEEALPNHCIYW